MKIFIPILFVLLSCSKSKEEIPANAIKITVNAHIVNNKYWAVSIYSEKPIVSEGTAKVEWDVWSNGQFAYKRSADITYKFDGNQLNSPEFTTTVQGAVSMSAKNGKIISMSGTGGYSFRN